MKRKYTFDVSMAATITVEAVSVATARDTLPRLDFMLARDPAVFDDSSCELDSCSMDDEAGGILTQIDGVDVDGDE
jgi:hypothetical protein